MDIVSKISLSIMVVQRNILNLRYGGFLDAIYDDIRKLEMNYPEKKLTPLIKMTDRTKGNYDKHRLNMLLRKLSVPKFDAVINKETFSTIRLVTNKSNRAPVITIIK